jgi:galactokinase
MDTTTALAPGRLTLLGEHPGDAGLACALAVDLVTTTTVARGGPLVRLVSATHPDEAVVPLGADPALVRPRWARLVAGVVAALGQSSGGVGTVESAVPAGAGFASGAALVLSVALALGFSGSPRDLASFGLAALRLAAVDAPGAPLDHAAVAHGRAGHAVLLDLAALTASHVALPPGGEVVAVHPGTPRAAGRRAVLARRRAECARAAAEVGPLHAASPDAVERLGDPILRARARHVVADNARVPLLADALRAGDLVTAGRLLSESHAGLSGAYAVSTPAHDALAARLAATPGVFGARLSGPGLGGCVVALTRPGVLREGWRVQAAAGARVAG